MFATPTKSHAWSSSVSLTIFAQRYQQWCHKDVDVNPRDRNKHTAVSSSVLLTHGTQADHTQTHTGQCTLSKTQTETCVTGCLTRCHEAEAFCSWLPISSINSLPSTHPTPPLASLQPPPWPERPPWLRGYPSLWKPLAGKRATLSPSGHHTVAALGR